MITTLPGPWEVGLLGLGLTGEVRLDLLRYIHLTPHASNELSHAGSDGRRPSIAGVRMDGRQPRTERPSARVAQREFSHGSHMPVLKGQRQDLDVLDRGEAACAVELERRDVAGFCLNGQSDGPGGGSCLADGANERPRHPAVPRAGYDVQIPELPRTSKP